MKHRFSTFEELVGFYESDLQLPLLKELALCRAAVKLPLDNRRKAEILLMGGHQWHLNIRKRAKAKDHIIGQLEESKLWERKYTNFEEVYEAVAAAIGATRYVGDLTLYDVAKRIGFCCGHEPEQVYLHGGARVGARNLLGVTRLYGKKKSVGQFGKFFPTLSALHIENILCIAKELFAKGRICEDKELDSDICCFKCYFEIPEELWYIVQAKTVAEIQMILQSQTK